MRRHAILFAAAGLLVLLAAGCGRDRARPEAQPAPNATVFVDGHFDDIPLYPRADPVGSRSEKNGTVARSYSVPNATAEQVLTWYRDRLPSWQVTEAPRQVGTTAYRGRWRRNGYVLTISASPAPTLSGGSSTGNVPVTQFNLELTSPGAPAPGAG